jgi:hypothetical protein
MAPRETLRPEGFAFLKPCAHCAHGLQTQNSPDQRPGLRWDVFGWDSTPAPEGRAMQCGRAVQSAPARRQGSGHSPAPWRRAKRFARRASRFSNRARTARTVCKHKTALTRGQGCGGMCLGGIQRPPQRAGLCSAGELCSRRRRGAKGLVTAQPHGAARNASPGGLRVSQTVRALRARFANTKQP